MNWHEPVDLYCERSTAAFWAEPLNAISNAAFIIAAFAIWWTLRSSRGVPASVGFTVPMAVAIGLGSFAFHTFATRFTQLLDIVPIALFMLCFFAAYLRWFYRLSWKGSLVGVTAFLAGTAVVIVFGWEAIPNGSAPYVPALVLLVGLTAVLAASKVPERARYWKQFAAASAVFATGLTARTVDESVCGSFPTGLHFLWHMLDGLLVFLVSRSLIQKWRSVEADAELDRALASEAAHSRP